MGVETIAIATLATTVLAAGVSAYGMMQQGAAAKSAADYQSQVAANNAIIGNQNARYAIQAGNAQAEQSQIKTNQIVGAMMAAQASSGVDVGSGSPLDTRTSQKEIGALDVAQIRNNAARQAYGYQTGAMSNTAQSQLLTVQGQNAATAGEIGGVSSILGGASSFGKNYVDFSKVGAFSAPSGLSTAGAG